MFTNTYDASTPLIGQNQYLNSNGDSINNSEPVIAKQEPHSFQPSSDLSSQPMSIPITNVGSSLYDQTIPQAIPVNPKDIPVQGISVNPMSSAIPAVPVPMPAYATAIPQSMTPVQQLLTTSRILKFTSSCSSWFPLPFYNWDITIDGQTQDGSSASICVLKGSEKQEICTPILTTTLEDSQHHQYSICTQQNCNFQSAIMDGNTLLGTVVYNLCSCNPLINVLDTANREIFTIQGSACQMFDIKYDVINNFTGSQGSIVKEYSYISYTYVPMYFEMEIPENSSFQEIMLLIGAVITISKALRNNQNSNNNDQNHHHSHGPSISIPPISFNFH